MEMNNSDEPNAKRAKLESEGSTSSKPEAKDPFLSLPSDILATIIGYVPIAQWPSLELVDKNFRANTWIAWRQLRNVNVDREFIIKGENEDDDWSIGKSVISILQKLVEHSPFLISLSGIDIRLNVTALNSDAVQLLAKFEHLQSITVGDAKLNDDEQGLQLEAVVEFLKATRSRTSLKELRLYEIDQCHTVYDRFASSFANGREIRTPLKLEKLSFSSCCSLHIRWDTLDTSRLIDVRLGKALIHPDNLTNLIKRALNLRLIEFSFLHCWDECDRPCLQSNKKLLAALASHENLMAISFGDLRYVDYCGCLDFEPEFMEMLKSIGRRGKLRKLALDMPFVSYSDINIDDVCETIRDKMPYLKSIKLSAEDISDEKICDMVGLVELEEIRFSGRIPISTNAMKKIALLPHLKRLAFNVLDANTTSLKELADAPALTDLRIRSWISGDVFEKWSDGFASNLQILMLSGVAEQNEDGLVRLLESAVRLRVLILHGCITDRTLAAIAESCPDLEVLGVRSTAYDMTAGRLREILDRYPDLESVGLRSVLGEITIRLLQEIVDRCPKLKKLGGIEDEIRDRLNFPKYRKIGAVVDMEFGEHDFDDDEYA